MERDNQIQALEAENKKAKVMVVDDNPMVLSILENLLIGENYEVLTSNNGQEALSTLKDDSADIIICDVMMPEMDGYSFKEHLLNDTKHSKVPFVFLSGMDKAEDIAKGESSGADAYLVKPFEPDKLLSVIRGKLARYKQQQSLLEQEKEEFKKQVLRSITHEFRTPLVAVKTGSEFLLSESENLDTTTVKKILLSICRSGQRLEALVNNYILCQKIQSGTSEKAYQKNAKIVDLTTWMSTYLKQQEDTLKLTGFNLLSEIPEQEANAKLLPAQIKIIMDCLLDNAAKFSPNSTPEELQKIQVQMKIEKGRVLVFIRDYGSGFDEESLSEITTPFFQYDRNTFEQQGCGLGLAIATELARINQGTVVCNNHEDGGAEVKLSFPLVS